MKILEHLKTDILDTITNHAYKFREEKGSAPIEFKGEEIGEVDYIGTFEDVPGMRSNNYDIPNDEDEVSFTIESINVTIWDKNSERKLENINKYLSF